MAFPFLVIGKRIVRLVLGKFKKLCVSLDYVILSCLKWIQTICRLPRVLRSRHGR
jgi:hypothetical protein